MTDEIWLPKGETKAHVRDGNVVVWDEMSFESRLVAQPTGFVAPKEEEDDES